MNTSVLNYTGLQAEDTKTNKIPINDDLLKLNKKQKNLTFIIEDGSEPQTLAEPINTRNLIKRLMTTQSRHYKRPDIRNHRKNLEDVENIQSISIKKISTVVTNLYNANFSQDVYPNKKNSLIDKRLVSGSKNSTISNKQKDQKKLKDGMQDSFPSAFNLNSSRRIHSSTG